MEFLRLETTQKDSDREAENYTVPLSIDSELEEDAF